MLSNIKNPNRRWKSFIQHPFLLLITSCFLVAGCTYYNVKRITDIDSDKLKLGTELKKPNKYLILRTPQEAYHLQLKDLNAVEEYMICEVMPLPSQRHNYKFTKADKTNKQKSGFDPASQEIHFYTTKNIDGVGESFKLPFSDFYLIEVYEHNQGKSSSAVFGYVLGGVVLSAVVLSLLVNKSTPSSSIVSPIKSSCPFIYTKDSAGYAFSGEIYPGAIYKALERDDYLQLTTLTQTDNQYQIKLSNELMERQYTDLCQLIEVHHSQEVKVFLDKEGYVHTVSDLISPTTALTEDGVEVNSQIKCRDDDYYNFNELSKANGMNELILNFKKPQDALKAKLVLHGKNTYWLDYTFGKFYSNFGTYYDKHASLQDEAEADTNVKWAIDQGIRMGVWIKKNDRWVLVDHLEVAGPLANRTMLVPIDLHGVSETNVEIKLTSGFMFWELDEIGMDYSENQAVSIHYLEAVEAFDQDGMNVKNTLIKTDGKYLEQPGPGLETNISYKPAVRKADQVSSIFLHSRGYYEYIREYTNDPDYIALYKFKRKGAFSEFSRDNYLQFKARRSPQNIPSF